MKEKDSVPIWIVHVSEGAPPEGAIAFEWFLLTTLDIKMHGDVRSGIARCGVLKTGTVY